MDVKEAVSVAKTYVAEIYTDEAIEHLGLEEVDFDDSSDYWNVTIGFARPWNRLAPPAHPLSPASRAAARSYKVVRIDDDTGEVKSLKDRFFTDAD